MGKFVSESFPKHSSRYIEISPYICHHATDHINNLIDSR